MARILDYAVRDRLTGNEAIDPTLYPVATDAQARLRAVLGFDSTGFKTSTISGTPAVYKGNYNQGVQLPAITFQNSGGTNSGLPVVQQSGILEIVYMDMQFWSEKKQDDTPRVFRGDDVIAEIDECVSILLDVRKQNPRFDPVQNVIFTDVPPLALDGGVCYQGIPLVPLVDSYDPEQELFYGIVRMAWTLKR